MCATVLLQLDRMGSAKNEPCKICVKGGNMFQADVQVCNPHAKSAYYLLVDHLSFRKAMLARDMFVWEGLHISPRGAPSKGAPRAKLCTYLRWFAQPDRTSTEPYYELPLPVTKLRSIFGWVLIPCRLSRAGLRCLRCHGICAGAHFVQPPLSVMSAIVCLIALIFRAFGSSMQRFSGILMTP